MVNHRKHWEEEEERENKKEQMGNREVYNYRIQFALVGLLDMYNFGGAIEAIEVSSGLAITIKGREAGRFGAYSNLKPRFCSVNSREDGFLIHLKIAY
ncbi:hypothetical protein RJ639_012698 [Escallonia herrerae]|uniref:Uncharacterized protein n=1 Tax=Escallonia herrerae TaxID=1293975 RepID=A0AA88VMR5_9ASTE|nr:hypothetical protein RJ639_012698 [Escallonia herrerae]